MNTETEMLTISDFCKATRLGRTYVYSLLGKGDLKAIKIGRRTMIRRDDMDAWVASLNRYPSTNSKDEVLS